MPALYEVWMSCGQGTFAGPKFRLLEDARRYVAEHCTEASCAIKGPGGTWPVISPRSRLARGTRR